MIVTIITTTDVFAAIAVNSAEVTPVRQEFKVSKEFKEYRVLRVCPAFRVRRELPGKPVRQDRKVFRD
jgi:hypothetical protein